MHFFNIITKISEENFYRKPMEELTVFASGHMWLLMVNYFVEHTECDRWKIKEGSPFPLYSQY